MLHYTPARRAFWRGRGQVTPMYEEPHIRVVANIIWVVSIFIPFTLLIGIGDPELFLTIVFFVIPIILTFLTFSFTVTSVITAILMILFTLYLKG